jgi:hypothetical protein
MGRDDIYEQPIFDEAFSSELYRLAARSIDLAGEYLAVEETVLQSIERVHPGAANYFRRFQRRKDDGSVSGPVPDGPLA